MQDRKTGAQHLETAHILADVSAKAILPKFRRGIGVENKAGPGNFDPVTEADKAAERVIRRTLKARHPDHAAELPVERYGTPSGKVELASSLLAQWGQHAVPHATQPALFAEADAYPLILTSGGRVLEGFHQNAQHSARFRRHRPHPVALVHPRTAAAAGIEDGAWFEISTAIGSVRQIAQWSDKVSEQVVQADRWWYPEGSGEQHDPFGLWATNINVCTADDDANLDPVMGAWLLRGLPCRITAITQAPQSTPA